MGISGGFRGSHIQKSGEASNGWTDWHQLWYTSADSFGNGHRLNTITYSMAGPIGTTFLTHEQIYLGMDIRQTKCASRHKGGT